jgi:plastocyanin
MPPSATNLSSGRNIRAALLVLLVLAACTPAPASSVGAESSPVPSGESVTVTLSDSSFGPDITIAAGTTVMFVNGGGLKHTASNGTNGQLVENALFDIVLDPGASGSYTFDTAGSYPITCIVHPTMNMTITVE